MELVTEGPAWSAHHPYWHLSSDRSFGVSSPLDFVACDDCDWHVSDYGYHYGSPTTAMRRHIDDTVGPEGACHWCPLPDDTRRVAQRAEGMLSWPRPPVCVLAGTWKSWGENDYYEAPACAECALEAVRTMNEVALQPLGERKARAFHPTSSSDVVLRWLAENDSGS